MGDWSRSFVYSLMVFKQNNRRGAVVMFIVVVIEIIDEIPMTENYSSVYIDGSIRAVCYLLPPFILLTIYIVLYYMAYTLLY